MKNLKKALVLVLAFAMVFSLFTFNASAASFSDDEDIVNKEAVTSMVQLGIINGNPDGTFAPNRVVTRAEMCKMICVALNGGTEPLLDSGEAVFSDTVGHWASKYINYCYSMGIVSGDSGKGGVFRPDATVTALEAAKMMLVALGYNSTVAGFTGADWATNVAREANRKGLFDGIGALNANAGLTRDNAAQLIFNGINADMVDYENSLGTVNGQVVTIPKIKDLEGKTIITEKYKAIRVEGVVTDNEFVNAASKGKTTLTITNDAAKNVFGASDTFAVTTGADEFGKTIVLYVKPSVTTPADAVKGTVIGKAAISDVNNVYTTSEEISAANIVKTLAANGLAFTVDEDVKVYKNYDVNSAVTVKVPSGITSATALHNAAGVEAQYIDNNGDGIVDIITKTEYSFGIVENVGTNALNVKKLSSASYGTAAVNSTKAKDEVANFANLGLAKNDYVKFITVAGKHYVEKVNGVTITVNSTKGTDTITSTAGVTYTASVLADKFNVDNAATLTAAVSRGKTAVLYLDGAGNVIYVTDVDVVVPETKYLMLTQLGESTDGFTSKLVAKVLYDDGTTGTVTIAKYDLFDGGEGGNESAPKVVGKDVDVTTAKSALDALKLNTLTYDKAIIFSYKVDKNGNYELSLEKTKPVEIDNDDDGIIANIPVIDTGIIANSDTKFIIKNLTGDAFVTYEGIASVTTRLGDATAKLYVWAVTDDNGIAKIVFAQGGKSTVTTDTAFVYLLDTEVIVSGTDEKPVYSFKVVRNGVVEEIKAKANNSFGDSPTAGIYEVTYEDGLVSSATKAVSGNPEYASKVAFAGKGIIGNAGGTFAYDANTKFLIVDGDEVTEAEISDIVTEFGSEDNIAIIADAKTNVAKYVFIVRTQP